MGYITTSSIIIPTAIEHMQKFPIAVKTYMTSKYRDINIKSKLLNIDWTD
jgi:hypothetical protein